MKTTLPNQYFDDVYQNNEDPWSFETSPYEKEKYQTTIDALPKNNYNKVFEIGCSIGVLTEMLLKKSTDILAVDPAQTALDKAAKRLHNDPNVTFKQMSVPNQFPIEQFDLIVLSEVGYYLSMPDLKILANKMIGHLNEGGQLIMVHWLPIVHDYPLTGDKVHNYFLSLSGNNKPLLHLSNQRKEKYRLDLFQKQ